MAPSPMPFSGLGAHSRPCEAPNRASRRALPKARKPFLAALALTLCLVSPLSLSAQPESGIWVSMETGKRLFAEGRLGEALVAFKRAIEERRTGFERLRERLAAVMRSKEAGKAKGSIAVLVETLARVDIPAWKFEELEASSGGSLRALVSRLRESRISDSLSSLISVIEGVLEFRPSSAFGDSLEALQSEAARLVFYPEAEFWIGRVYAAEAEYSLALRQYKRAYDMRESLDTPEMAQEMLYALTDCAEILGDMHDYEAYLLEILSGQAIFSDKGEAFLREAMERTLREDGFDRFMVLYRVDAGSALAAYDRLSAFYYKSGRVTALLPAALAVNGALTRIIESLKEKEPDYAYQGLDELLARARLDAMIAAYAESIGLYRLLYNLGAVLYANGIRTGARVIWASLAPLTEAGVYAVRARAQLANPQVRVPSVAP